MLGDFPCNEKFEIKLEFIQILTFSNKDLHHVGLGFRGNSSWNGTIDGYVPPS